MARKNYSDEFRRQAVDVYESGPGATVRGIADDLGVERGTLRHWARRARDREEDGGRRDLDHEPAQARAASAALGGGPGRDS